MRLLVHLLRSDARRVRLAIALWIVVSALSSIAASAVPVFGGQGAAAAAAGTAGTLISLAGLVLSVALVPLVVQTHPAVGSDAFWMTRPLRPAMVLASKLLLTGAVFLAVPAMFEALRAAAHGVSAADAALVAAESVLMRSLLLAALLVGAVLTRDLARFAMVCGALLLALALVPTIAIMFLLNDTPRLTAFVSPGGEAPAALPRTSSAAPLVAALAIVSGALAVAWVQYAARRTLQSVVVAGVSLATTILVGVAWPWPPTSEIRPSPGWAQAPSSLRLIAEAPTERSEPDLWADGVPRRTVRVPLRLTRAEPGWLAVVRMTGGTLTLDGMQLALPGDGGHAAVPDDPNERAWPSAVRDALQVRVVPGMKPPRDENPGLVLSVAASALPGSSAGQGQCRGEFSVDLARLEIAAILPLQPGASFQEGAYRFVVDGIRPLGQGLSLNVRVSNVATMFDRRSRPVYTYHLRNPGRGEALIGAAHDAQPQMSLPFVGGWHLSRETAGFTSFAHTVAFGVRGFGLVDGADLPPAIDSAWMSGAELVILRARYDGSVARTLEIPNLRFQGS